MGSSDKETTSNEVLQKIVVFLQKNIRYISAGVLLLILVLVLVNCTGGGEGNHAEPATETEITAGDAETEIEESYQIDAYEKVNNLISQYYAAYAAGDLNAMASLAAPISENEQSYITMFSQYVEGYQNLKCYTKSGLEEGSYLVSAYTDLKFTDIDTAAPSLEFFYVRTDEHGTIYIDNAYSWYNLAKKENVLDENIQKLINDFENEEDVLALQQEVWEKYDSAVAADENLNKMFTETIPAAVQQWNAKIAAQRPSTEQTAESTEAAVTEEPEQAEAQSTEEPESTQEQTPAEKETLYATERVNVRAAADVSSEKLGNVEMGAAVTRIGTEGEWSIIEFNGGTGYVKSEFLNTDMSSANTDTAENTAVGSLAEGTVVMLSSTTNIRSSMSETSEKVGTAYMGEKVTVVMSYAEGWTKVSWNGKTGYIKTSLLQ